MTDYFDNLGFICFAKHRKRLAKIRSGGLVACVKKKSKNQTKIYETASKLVMWLELKVKIDSNSSKTLLIGNIYIPPSGSIYADADCFNEVESELDELKSHHDVHVCLAGDFNARTGEKSEFNLASDDLDENDLIVDPDLYSRLETEEVLIENGIPLNRVTQDETVNEYGGDDADKGKTT